MWFKRIKEYLNSCYCRYDETGVTIRNVVIRSFKKQISPKTEANENNWVELYLKPIVDELIRLRPDLDYLIWDRNTPCVQGGEINNVDICFRKRNINSFVFKRPHSERFLQESICFRLENLETGELIYLNTKQNTKQFKEGSFGDINGLNTPWINFLAANPPIKNLLAIINDIPVDKNVMTYLQKLGME